jgi:DNA-binding HxlR family transcriptional regulator
MKGYGQFCPIAVACETFAERWTPLILRELLNGPRRFSELQQGMPLISRSLLSQRLRQLEEAGVVESSPRARGHGREYRATAAAEEFRDVLDGLGRWGQRWATGQFEPENLDLTMLMWSVRGRIALEKLPPKRTVVRFEFRAFPPRCRPLRTCWLVLERRGADVCLRDPGYDVALVVRADASTMARFWTGHVSFEEAVASGGLAVEGPRELARAFPGWLLRSRFAGVGRVAERT